MSVAVQRESQGKQYKNRQAHQVIDENDSDIQNISNSASDFKLPIQAVEETMERSLNLACEPSLSCKRPAPEEVTAGDTTKRQRAPRAP